MHAFVSVKEMEGKSNQTNTQKEIDSTGKEENQEFHADFSWR